METQISQLRMPTSIDAALGRVPNYAPLPVLALRLDDGREVGLEKCVRIGSAPTNDLVLHDPFVSELHCTIVRLSGRVVLKDMGSRNGCWLDSKRVRLAELGPGARLTLGGTVCEVVAIEEKPHAILGVSEAVVTLRRELARAGATALPVLLQGESGTGKELAAAAIHEASGRRGKLVAVNCGALSRDVVESELFGHERGAFTGASGRRVGLFEEAEGGTLLLDEIGELPLDLQPKLLRALETGTVRPVGSSTERRVNVRIVAATHRNLRAEASRGTFRLDLYHRLCAIEVRLPALRERPQDIPLLARHFLDTGGAGGPARRFSQAALAEMLRHRWSGNVRELRNAVLRASHLGGTEIEPADLFPRPFDETLEPGPAPHVDRPGEAESVPLHTFQKQLVAHALKKHRGNIRAAARELGLPHSTLHDRVKRWQLQ